MQNLLRLTALMLSVLGIFGGCNPKPSETTEDREPLVWVETDIKHERMTITLGYRSNPVDANRWIAPAAAITQDGAPVGNAMVFCRFVSAEGEQTIGNEIATVYEPSSSKEPAHYGNTKLDLPQSNSHCVVRFRVVLPDIDRDWTRDVKIVLR